MGLGYAAETEPIILSLVPWSFVAFRNTSFAGLKFDVRPFSFELFTVASKQLLRFLRVRLTTSDYALVQLQS